MSDIEDAESLWGKDCLTFQLNPPTEPYFFEISYLPAHLCEKEFLIKWPENMHGYDKLIMVIKT